MAEYHPFYSDIAAEFFVRLPKRKQRKLLDICNQLARNPLIKPDYTVRDSDGRDIGHILVEGFVIAYWVDHPVCKLMIVDVDPIQ